MGDRNFDHGAMVPVVAPRFWISSSACTGFTANPTEKRSRRPSPGTGIATEQAGVGFVVRVLQPGDPHSMGRRRLANLRLILLWRLRGLRSWPRNCFRSERRPIVALQQPVGLEFFRLLYSSQPFVRSCVLALCPNYFVVVSLLLALFLALSVCGICIGLSQQPRMRTQLEPEPNPIKFRIGGRSADATCT